MLDHFDLELQMLVNHTVLALDESSEYFIPRVLSPASIQVLKVSYLDIHFVFLHWGDFWLFWAEKSINFVDV